MDDRFNQAEQEGFRLATQIRRGLVSPLSRPGRRSVFVGVALLLALLMGTNTRAYSASPESDITSEGTVQASTTTLGYPASLAVDGDPTTSWFSTGPEPGGVPTRFQWTHPRDDLITTIYIHGNGQNKNPGFRTGFGFAAVTVQVLDASSKVQFQQAVQLPGTPDPDVIVHPNVVGRTVLLLFTGHESPDCGGFSELQVKANRTTPPTATIIPATQLAVNTGTIIASDDLNRPDADRCKLGALDNALGGSRTLYYLPIFPGGGNNPSNPIGANIVGSALQNNGSDYGGVQFAPSPPCQAAIGAIRGSNLGQDLNIRVDVLVPTDPAGHISQAGPYVRSRAAAYGDGIIGGTSAGYWVRLESTGEVTIRRLNPNAVIAFTGKPSSFDSTAVHTLEIAAGGSQLQVALDGNLQTFNAGNELATTVPIPPTAGSNDGTAGIAFGAEANRGQIGGQRADNVVITVYHSLNGLLVHNNFASAANATLTVAPNASPTPLLGGTAVPTTVASNSVPTAGALGLKGDCDGDGKITEVDALCALEMSVGLRPVQSNTDMDNSGSVTSRDAVIILQRAIGK